MAKKKIMLFIVEGPTDETSLSTVLSRIFSSSTVRFHIVHGDILTRDFVTQDKIIVTVNEQVKAFRGSVYRTSDICKIVHLTDMDGVFVPDTAVIENHERNICEYPYYTKSSIMTPTPQTIITRNKNKRANINKLSSVGAISKIPYSLYYFSLNLDHVLHGKTNLTEEEKIELATKFDLKYADAPDDFIRLMKDAPFSVSGTYGESWSFIKSGLRSLERYSNFGMSLPESCGWTTP